MISETLITSKIKKARAYWDREANTEYVQGVRLGLKIADEFLADAIAETRAVRMEYRGRINRWQASEFFNTIGVALRAIKRGDKITAVNALQRQFDRVGGDSELAQ